MTWITSRRLLLTLCFLDLGLNTCCPPSSELWARTIRGEQKESASSSLAAVTLRCDFQTNPSGLQNRNPRFSWIPEARANGERGVAQTAYRILVASSPKMLAAGHGDLWDSGKVSGSAIDNIVYWGKALESHREYYWKIQLWDQNGRPSSWSSVQHWISGLLDESDWQARWIAAGEEPAAGAIKPQPLPIFRRDFEVEKTLSKAVVFVSGLGQYELKINGQPVSEDLMSPGWTNYGKTVLYNTYDVTPLFRKGTNAIAVMLGNGMYNMPKTPKRYQKFVGSFGQPKLRLQLHLAFSDGTTKTLISDRSWKVASGPITFSSIYGGEDYDARLEQEHWSEAGSDISKWQSATEVEGPGGQMVAQQIPPIRVLHTYEPVKTSEPKAGVKVYDLGQNFSGWPSIKVQGPAGAVVKITPGELLDKNGLVTQKGSGGPEYFSYTLKGKGIESWHPSFSYYGFRYLQVEMQSSNPEATKVVAVAGQFLSSSTSVVGEFSSSDPLLNDTHRLINMAIRSNMQSILTDCPTREKLGWIEQNHLIGRALFDGYDIYALYAKMAGDMRDSQLPDGLIPEIAPEYVAFVGGAIDFRDSPEWGSSAILSPWIAYQYSGNLQLLADQYPAMQKYVDYLESKASGHLLSQGLGDWYDIGPGAPGYSKLTSKAVTATGVYYQSLSAMRQIARLLHKDSDAARYDSLAKEVHDAFNAALFHRETSQYDKGSQTANALPLVVGLVPDGYREKVLANLVSDIRSYQNHLTAGDIGFHYVLLALLQGGRSDVIYDMLSRKDAPSYGDQLAKGATSLTEAWDANPTKSQNHFMLGHAEEWFFEGLAGIHFDLTQSSDKQIEIRPQIIAGIHKVVGSYNSLHGKISSQWERKEGRIVLRISVPANSQAEVSLPVVAEKVTEGGKPIASRQEIKFLRKQDGDSTEGKHTETSIYQVGSGEYQFEWPDALRE